MRKKQKKYPICPCCSTPRNPSEMREVRKKMKTWLLKEQRKRNPSLLTEPLLYHYFDADNCYWACDLCWETKTLLPTKIEEQNFCTQAHLAYFDTTHECQRCQKIFCFTAREKQYWFEELKFWVESVPIHCLECRKVVRNRKQENNLLSELLRKDQSELTKLELEQIIQVYDKWGKEERKKYFQALLQKRK